MAETNRQKFQKSNPNSLATFIQRLGGLASVMESMLPTASRAATSTGIAVASNTSGALGFAGEVKAVTATAASSTGAKTIVSGSPSAGECQVTYSAAGVPTLTFNGSDAVTEASIVANEMAADIKAFLASETW